MLVLIAWVLFSIAALPRTGAIRSGCARDEHCLAGVPVLQGRGDGRKHGELPPVLWVRMDRCKTPSIDRRSSPRVFYLTYFSAFVKVFARFTRSTWLIGNQIGMFSIRIACYLHSKGLETE